MPCIALYALLIINSIKHEGLYLAKAYKPYACGFAPCLSGASCAFTRAVGFVRLFCIIKLYNDGNKIPPAFRGGQLKKTSVISTLIM
jgi:hypothetical protein